MESLIKIDYCARFEKQSPVEGVTQPSSRVSHKKAFKFRLVRNEALLQQHWTQCFAIKISVVFYIILDNIV